jgi:hypothetical protein
MFFIITLKLYVLLSDVPAALNLHGADSLLRE